VTDTPDVEWEIVLVPDEFIVARCARCFRCCGVYWARTEDLAGGEWRPGTCACDPVPVLPAGNQLVKLARRAVATKRPGIRKLLEVRCLER
jgi:hypothetical protein